MRYAVGTEVLTHRDTRLARPDDDYFSFFTGHFSLHSGGSPSRRRVDCATARDILEPGGKPVQQMFPLKAI
nr:hypothetical protein StreXyl84_01760 [Streptomyces sp. Xyl84]